MSERLDRRASAQPAAKAWFDGARTLTYGDAHEVSERLAGWAEAAGLAGGDVVLVASADPAVMALAVLGLVRAGLTAAIIDPVSTKREAAHVVATAGAAAAIADETLIDAWGLRSSPLRQVIAVTPAQPTLASRLLRGVRRARSVAGFEWLETAERRPLPQVPPERAAYIIFTSGTTAQPKGVVVSHRALTSHLLTLHRQFLHDEQSRILNVLPMSHADGLIQGPFLAYFSGGTLVRPAEFSTSAIDAILAAVYARRITHFVAVPTMLSLMLRFGSRELNDVFKGGDFKCVTSAAAHLEQDLWEKFERRYGVLVANLYGLTETVTGSIFSGPDPETRFVGSLGKPVDADVRIVDENGSDVPNGDIGEILVSGPHLMTGYAGDDDATSRVLRDGWLHTGDLARRDASGFIHYTGRRKTLIISAGRNIQPEEVVEVLRRHPAVVDAAVVGEPDDVFGEVPVAVVVLRRDLAPAALATHARESLSEYKVPRRIVVVEEIPKGRTGKVNVEGLRQLLDGPPDTSRRDKTTLLMQVAAGVFRVPPDAVSLDSTPDNTPGWDSLAHLMLAAALERTFSVSLAPADIVGISSLRDALRLVSPNGGT